MDTAIMAALRRGFSSACIALILSALLASPSAVYAQLAFTIHPDQIVAGPGDLVTFSGTLTNTSASELFLNGDTYNLAEPDLILDDSPFLLNFPLSLQGGETASGDLFTVNIGPNTLPDTYPGSFVLLGGPSASDFNELATQSFRVAVPEPGVGVLLLCGGITLGIGGKRLKRTSDSVTASV